MESLPDEVRPCHFIAADLGAVCRRAAEEGDSQAAGRLGLGDFRAAETKGINRNWTEASTGDRDAQARRRVNGEGLFDPPEVAVTYFMADAYPCFGEQQKDNAENQRGEAERRRAPPSRQ